MGILTAAYALVWAAVALYVGWMGLEQRRIAARLRDLQSQEETTRTTAGHAKAA